MPEQNADQSLKQRSNQQSSRQNRLGGLGVALLLSLALGHTAINYLVPKVSNRAPEATARWEWYFRQGQFQADCRTFAAAVQFLLDSKPSIPVATNYASLPLANDAAPDASQS